MSLASPTDPIIGRPSGWWAADRLATGLLALGLLTIAQRAIGLIRNVVFCQWLDPSALGLWSLVFTACGWLAPLAVIGLPGTFARFVPHFRETGQLWGYLRTVGIWSTAASLLMLCGLFLARDLTRPWLLGEQTSLVMFVATLGAIATTIAFHTLCSCVSAFQRLRIASLMQAVQGLGFTVISLTSLLFGGGVQSVVSAWSLANLLACIPGVCLLMHLRRHDPTTTAGWSTIAMWKRIGRYALAIWCMNWLANGLELADRYILLHGAPGDAWQRAAIVGSYHAGRTLPQVLLGIGLMLSGAVMPYLAADWERGQRQRVARRVRQIMFSVSLSFTAAAAVAMVASPWLFGAATSARLATGLQFTPALFVISIWFTIALLAQDLLWCAERGWAIALALALSLLTLLWLGPRLLDTYGLAGLVGAGLVAHGQLLLSTWWLIGRVNYRHGPATLWTSLAPASLLAGPWTSLAMVALITLGTRAGRRAAIQAWHGVSQRVA